MEKGLNLRIFELKENLRKTLNEAQLPYEVLRSATHEVYNELENLTNQAIEQERKAYEDSLNETE
ncbi:MAG: hypothetical protein ACK5JH_15180 [Anaerocolumna sp.]